MELFMNETGPLEADTIVFLHGGGASSWMWQPVIEKLGDFHCLAPDLPEHGRTTAGPFSMPGAADAVAELIRLRTPAGRAHVVGLSLGAQVLVALLSRAPEVLESVVISSALLRPLPGAGLYGPWLQALTYWSMVAPFKKWDAWIRLNARYSSGIPDRYFEHARQDFQSLTRDAWVHIMSENLAFRLPPGLERFKQPALVIAGQKEYAPMRKSAEDLLAVLPNARGVKVRHNGQWSLAEEHNWALKDLALFADTVRAWVTGSPLPEGLVPLR